MELSYPRTFVPGNESPLELLSFGTFFPGNFRSQELSSHDSDNY